jgi:hypothetical protein
MTKRNSIYPKTIQKMIRNAHTKRLSSHETAMKINNSTTARKLGVTYSPRSIAIALGNLTRNYSNWAI